MPADLWTDAIRMVTSGAIVAAVAAPVGILALTMQRRSGPLLPRWTPMSVPWTGFEVLAAFFVIVIAIPQLVLQLLSSSDFFLHIYGEDFRHRDAEAATVRMLWANLVALPLQLVAVLATRYWLYRAWRPKANSSVRRKVLLAVIAWFVIAPVVLLLNAAVTLVYSLLELPQDTHSLTKLGGRPVLDEVLLLLEACIGAPLREELFFRGILLWWCVDRMRIPGAGVSRITSARPWFVMVATVALAVMDGKAAAMIFVALLALGLGVLWRLKHFGARRARAVYATAAFFALIHSNVWPSPIPLFVLGLGLGWLAVRTNGLLVPVIVHGLFNAVSVVFVLRSVP